MIYLHTLGDTLIKVGEKDVRPTSPLVFAALLYLGIERGRRVPRAALQELLFPRSSERSGAHSLRQLLYKLRQLGAPIEADTVSVSLPMGEVSEECSSEDMLVDGSECLERLARGILPSYEPGLSEDYDLWLDETRATIAARVRSQLLTALSRARNRADRPQLERLASALLKIDPLNEEATLVRAMAMALNGQKLDAVRMLEDYSAEVGRTSSKLQLPPDVLRRRIAERLGDTNIVPLIGRQEELSWLLSQFDRAAGGTPTISVVWGEAGVGKTRLVQEFASHLLLKHAHIESAHSQPHDIERPLGAFIDLVPKLLEARGALGVSPESMQALRRFAGQSSPETDPLESQMPEVLATRIRRAVADLIGSVAGESPLVLVVEDAHWLDSASVRLLFSTFAGQPSRVYLLLTYRNQPHFPDGVRLSENVFVRHLEPLGEVAAGELLARTLGTDYELDDSVRAQCVALGAGNPLFLCTIAQHLRLRGTAPASHASVVDLLRQRTRILEAHSLLLLRFVAALGTHGTQARLTECCGMSVETGLLALQDVADRGLVVMREGVVKCSHDLLSEVVLSDAPEPIRTAVYERVATILERDGVTGKQVNLLWSCAESWSLAGNQQRSTTSWRFCSEAAVMLGQPALAVAALERAQETCGRKDQQSLVEESVRVADLVADFEAVLRNAHRYRLLLSDQGQPVSWHHEVVLAEINAMRRTGQPVWHLRDELRRCALNTEVAPSQRLRALRTFIVAAHQFLARDEAIALYSACSWPPWRDLYSPARDVHMIYHWFFGDVEQSRMEAHALLAKVRKDPEISRPSVLGNIAQVLFQCGETELAIEVCHEAALLDDKLGIQTSFLLDCGRLADLYLLSGDIANARMWHDKSERLQDVADYGLGAFQLSMKIWFALRDGNIASAQMHLNAISTYPEASIPHSSRSIRGMEILAMNLAGSLRLDPDELAELERVDDMACRSPEHQVFALALFVALRNSGYPEKASNRMRNYVTIWRRERYPLWPYYEGLAALGDAEKTLRTLITSPGSGHAT